MSIPTQQIMLRSAAGGQTLGSTDAQDVKWSSGETEINTYSLQLQTLVLRVTVGTAALTGFRVLGKVHLDDTVWTPLASAAGDYASSPFVRCRTYNSSHAFQDNDITTLAATEYAVLTVLTANMARVKFEVTGGATSVVTAYLSGSSEPVALGMAVTVEANLGNAGLLNKNEQEVDPAESRLSNVAAAAGDALAPMGLVRKDTRALPEAVAAGDWVAAQGTASGELRTRDDDANTALGNIPAKGTAAMAASTPVTLASDDAIALAVRNALVVDAVAITGNAGENVLAVVGSAVTVNGKGKMSLRVTNTSDTALTNVALDVQAHASDGWSTILAGTDWELALPTNVLWYSGQSATGRYVNTLAAGEDVLLILNLGAPYAIRFQAQSTAASKALTIYGSAKA